MAIPETRKKIAFTPWTTTKGAPKASHETVPTASVYKKFGTLQFSKTLISETGMAGKFIRLYFEPTRKIIGWQLRTKVEQEEMKVWKLVRPTKSGTWSLGIRKMLNEIRLSKDSYPKLPVQKYREMSLLEHHHNEVFYFIELVEEAESAPKD